MRTGCFETAKSAGQTNDNPVRSPRSKALAAEKSSGSFAAASLSRESLDNGVHAKAAESLARLHRSPGQALDEPTQRRMAPYFGDLSHVRIHADRDAAESAEALQAAAYTWKHNVVFAPGRFRPATPEGTTLLMHELVHVAQQRTASDRSLPEVAPRDGLLEANTRAVLAGHADIASAPRAMIQRQSLVDPLPPVSLVRPKMRPSVLPQHLGFHLLPDDKQNIHNLLLAGHLAVGPYLNPQFEGVDTTLDAITDRARSLVLPIVPREEVSTFVRGEFLAVLVQTRELPPLPVLPFTLPPDPLTTVPAAPGASQTPDILKDWQAAAGGQWTYHIHHAGPQTSKSLQVQFTHGSGAVQEVFQYQVDALTGVAQPMAGLQLQGVKQRTVHGVLLQGSVFLQLMLGATQAPGEISGDVTIQIQGGLQGTATFGKISVALQLGLSLTVQGTEKPAFDFNVAPQAGNPDSPGVISDSEGHQFFGLKARF